MKCKNCGCPFANIKTGLCQWCEARGAFGAPRRYQRPEILNNTRIPIINRMRQ